MSSALQKLRSLLSGGNNNSQNAAAVSAAQRHSVSLEPEIGFHISIDINTVTTNSTSSINHDVTAENVAGYHKTTVPELNVHLIAARHLPALFGFKVVQGYLIKVKLFPGSKRMDSTIQTNSWPKFNENFKFPLAPAIKSSLKHSARRGSKSVVSEFSPEDLFAGQFVVFTVYALLELPPASFNRLNKTYRSLRDKSSNLMQKVVENSSGKSKDDKENTTNNAKQTNNGNNSDENQKAKRKSTDANPRNSVPPLTISESRRNIGSVTCYLEPKLFKRNARTGLYATEELWLPIKDITTSVAKAPTSSTVGSNLTNSTKGIVEIVLEIRDLSENNAEVKANENKTNNNNVADETTSISTATSSAVTTPTTPTTPSIPTTTTTPPINGSPKHPQWNRMASEVKRKMGISNISTSSKEQKLTLNVTTARMRCSNKVKDELESTAGSVYVKTTVFEHGIYVDSWKSSNFYPSLSTKWDIGNDVATLTIPLQSTDNLENMLIRTTLATKSKLGKKLVLGTVLVGGGGGGQGSSGNGAEHIKLLQDSPVNERVSMWYSFQ